MEFFELHDRKAYLKKYDYFKDCWGGGALTRLLYSEELAGEGEEMLIRAAKWFLLPHPSGRDHRGESDFVASKLIRALYLLDNTLSDKTRKAIRSFFTRWDFESKYKSENHMILFHAARYLYAQKFPRDYFTQYHKSAEEIMIEDAIFLHDFIRFRAKCGWAEFDSLWYAPESLHALLNLVDFADFNMSNLARMSADLIMLDMIADSTHNGLYGGAHGRIYEVAARDYAQSPMYHIYQYYFGKQLTGSVGIEVFSTSYRPSEYVYKALETRPDTWENYETKHLHSITSSIPHKQVPQVPGKIQKYTYVTPKYVIGAVNHQDDYPEGNEAAWYAHHQQHEWDLSLCSGTDMRIFTHHPGSFGLEGQEHGYWTGDLGCCCGQYFCHKNVVMVTHDIPKNEQPMIHAHIPLKKLAVKMDGKYLWFADEMLGVYGMLWFSNGYRKGSKKYIDEEVCSDGRKHGVVCMVGTEEEYGNFDAFQATVKEIPVTYDPGNCILRFGEYMMHRGVKTLCGQPVPFPDSTYECPWMHSRWKSGIIELEDVILDFHGWGKILEK